MKPKLVKRGRVWICQGGGAVGCGLTAIKGRRELEFSIRWNEAAMAVLRDEQGKGSE